MKFSATPKPSDEWTVNGNVIIKSKRVVSSIDEESAVLTISKIQEEDVGDYTLKLVNNVGEAAIEINVVIVREYNFQNIHFFLFLKTYTGEYCIEKFYSILFTEVPSAPGAPEPLEVTEDSVTLHWKKPDSDGNSPIVEYILEYQEKTETT